MARIRFTEDVERWASSHEASIYIADAILQLYHDDAERVWQDPTNIEKKNILQRAFETVDDDGACEDVLQWGRFAVFHRYR